MGKGDKRRPSSISRQEEAIRWLLATGKITFLDYERRYEQIKGEGKITKNGRVV